MSALEIRNQIVAGVSFSFKSSRKPSRTLTISAIIRPEQGNLFRITANDLKHGAGIYNEENILPIIEAALANRPQPNFRIR
jgi:hypothetical protein